MLARKTEFITLFTSEKSRTFRNEQNFMKWRSVLCLSLSTWSWYPRMSRQENRRKEDWLEVRVVVWLEERFGRGLKKILQQLEADVYSHISETMTGTYNKMLNTQLYINKLFCSLQQVVISTLIQMQILHHHLSTLRNWLLLLLKIVYQEVWGAHPSYEPSQIHTLGESTPSQVSYTHCSCSYKLMKNDQLPQWICSPTNKDVNT